VVLVGDDPPALLFAQPERPDLLLVGGHGAT
jgi:hypothetical protein